MTPVLINATLAIVVYSLWVRRDTWWSRWEARATLAVALEGCSIVLMSPWAGVELAPFLHRALGVWNVQQMAGHFCLIIAIAANVYHLLVRLADPDQVAAIMRRHIRGPVALSIAAMIPLFVFADQDFQPDMFDDETSGSALIAYQLVGAAVVIYLSGYVTRVLLALRSDPRAKTTVHLYLVSMAFATAACLVVIASLVFGANFGCAIWGCACLSIGIFAYGSARSWRAKAAWFTADAES
ncbi:hypothetical protein KIH27_16150 [Mycobacterium sp. M1]|uniref:GP55 protein n=1 Tax=Mycolicibacter acidiphilus TaxID=2835306 RepID=A0ABS5RLE3_9MYCO|nr:hypothetical protein [Mycolicibacter acidiphilus]MBS9535120.1 hypothetical protein [Mycolicibacter acidiphilus]